MNFYTHNGMKRPVRLSDKTRIFAYDSLNRKYGLDTLNTMSVSLDDIEGFKDLPMYEQHDLAVQRIGQMAPLRICEGEKISGAATLGLAIHHVIPATHEGQVVFSGTSHLTPDFETTLKKGLDHIALKAEEAYIKYKGTPKEEFSKSCIEVIKTFRVWHGRYLSALKGREEYKANYDNLLQVPFKPAENFYQAVQSLWISFAFTRLYGNWPGIGRIDHMLGDYLKTDLENGTLTLDDAREILAHFFIKGCEWINGKYIGSGDAQHYQNIILAGIDENGREVTNEVTYLVLDILEELGISDFPTTVRVNKNTSEKLLRRVAEVMRYGGGILAIYNEDLIIKSLTDYGYPLKEARNFANDGCWEVEIPGKTSFGYDPFDSLQILQKQTLNSYDSPPFFKDFRELYNAYIEDLRKEVENIYKKVTDSLINFKDDPTGMTQNRQTPYTVISIFMYDCIEKGLSYAEGGPCYNIRSPHIGGIADTVNSLYAVKKLVYDEKRLPLMDLMEILKNNWEGEEVLRQYVLNQYDYYGNDNDEVDSIAVNILSDFADICFSFDGKCGIKFPGGVSTFGRQLQWAPHRLACPHGRRANEILSANCSPTPGTDKEGATATIRSYCKADLAKLPIGAALDIKLLPSSVEGEEGIEALVGLFRGFVSLGGFFMQPDVADASLLRKAQENPDEYRTLSVRVSGWNARFVTLNKEWQDMIIAQNQH